MKIKRVNCAKDFFFYGQTRKKVEEFLRVASSQADCAAFKVKKMARSETSGGGLSKKMLNSSWRVTLFFNGLSRLNRFTSDEKVMSTYRRLAVKN